MQFDVQVIEGSIIVYFDVDKEANATLDEVVAGLEVRIFTADNWKALLTMAVPFPVAAILFYWGVDLCFFLFRRLISKVARSIVTKL